MARVRAREREGAVAPSHKQAGSGEVAKGALQRGGARYPIDSL